MSPSDGTAPPEKALQAHAHRRFNPLTGEWILVSPERIGRPWQGRIEDAAKDARAAHDPACHLCPGNARIGGAVNPHYTGTFVFDNDHPALTPGSPDLPTSSSALLQARAERGICRVLCYAPRHDLSLGALPVESIHGVVDAWAAQFAELATVDWINAVTIFENRGTMMGASSPHPHGQIWANESVPYEIERESRRQREHLEVHGRCLLCEYLATELAVGERVVGANEHFVSLVPFWATWPFETLVLPRNHARSLLDLDPAARADFARILKDITERYDALFGIEFPYSMGLHQRPTDAAEQGHWHLHAHFHPPLLRSATIRKHMVGYELFAGPQRDLTPEAAVARLRGAGRRLG